MLSMLVFDTARSWRARRVDRFSGVDWDYFKQETALDIVLDASMVRDSLEALSLAYAATKQHAELTAPILEVLNELRGESAPGSAGASACTMLVPVLWVPGPLMGFAVSSGGADLAPLSRRETADAMSSVLRAAMSEARTAGLIPTAPKDPGPAWVWHDLGWLLTAADAHSLHILGPPASRPGAARKDARENAIVSWLEENLTRSGLSAARASQLVAHSIEKVLHLLSLSDAVGETLRAEGKHSSRRPTAAAEHSPAINPLLMYRSFIGMLDWLAKSGQPHPCAGSGSRRFEYFLELCEYWLQLVSQLSGSVDANPEDSAARALLHQLIVLGDNWPIIVRAEMPMGSAKRFVVRQGIYAPTRRASSAAMARANWSPASALMNSLRRLPVGLWSWTSSVIDYAYIESGRRTRLFSQHNAQSYPLVLGDASSLHVEIVCERPEMLLVPRSGFIKLPTITYPNSLIRWLLDRNAWTRGWAPRKKVMAPQVFGRVTDDGQRIQHFYTTKTPAEVSRALAEEGSVLADEGGQPLLVVRYRIERWVSAVNLVVVGIVVSMAAVIVWSALDMAARAAGGYTEPATTGLVFDDALKVAVPTILAALLLFAFEKHADRAVAETLRGYSKWVFWAACAIAIAAAGVTAVTAPGVIGFLPDAVVETVADVWTSVAKGIIANEPSGYRLVALAFALAGAAAALPLVLWAALLLIGNVADTLSQGRRHGTGAER